MKKLLVSALIGLSVLTPVVFVGCDSLSSLYESTAVTAVNTAIENAIATALPIAAQQGSVMAQEWVTANAGKYNLTSDQVTAINNAIASTAASISTTTSKSVIDWKSKDTYNKVKELTYKNLKK